MGSCPLPPPTPLLTLHIYLLLLSLHYPSSIFRPFLIIVASYFVLLLFGKKVSKGYSCNKAFTFLVFLSFSIFSFFWGKLIVNMDEFKFVCSLYLYHRFVIYNHLCNFKIVFYIHSKNTMFSISFNLVYILHKKTRTLYLFISIWLNSKLSKSYSP